MKLKSKNIIICAVLVIVTGVLLLNHNQAAQPLQLQDNSPTSSVLVTASRDRMLFPAQCVYVTWRLEGIREVYLNGHGEIGQGAGESCTVGKPPVFRVVFQDGHEATYALPVTQSYSTPFGLLVLIIFVVSLAILAGLAVGPRAMLLVLVIAIFGPLLRAQVNLVQDYIDHNMFAAIAMSDPHALPPHFLYHVSAIGLFESRLVPNIENGGYLVMLLAAIVTALATYQLLQWLNRRHQGSQIISGYVWVPAVLALMLLGPISLLRDTLLPGQGNAFLFANTYYNPTVNLLKPLAVLLFFTILNMIYGTSPHPGLLGFSAACLTVLATLAKPSYTIAIVPAIGLLIVYSFFRSSSRNRARLFISVLIPAGLVLTWQYFFLFGPDPISQFHGGSTRIVFAPFDYFITLNHVTYSWLLFDLLASIAFPALIYVMYWRDTRNNTALNLSWLVFLITLAQAYFFNERPDGAHGNLTWGTQIGSFILFAVSFEYLAYKVAAVVRNHERINWQIMAGGAVFLAHTVSHIIGLLSV